MSRQTIKDKDKLFIYEFYEHNYVKAGNGGTMNKDECAKELNELLGYNFGESALRKCWSGFNPGMEAGLNKSASQKQLLRIAKRDLNVKKSAKIVSIQRQEVNSAIKDIANTEVIPQEMLEEYNKYKIERSKDSYKVKTKKKNENYPIYISSDEHYGLEQTDDQVPYNEYSPEVAKNRIFKLFENIANDILINNYESVGIFLGGDSIEGSGNLRVSQKLHVRKTIVQQASEVSNVFIQAIDKLKNTVSDKKVKIDLFVVDSDNHSELRLNLTSRNEVKKECMQQVVADKILTAYRGDKVINVAVDDIVAVDVFGYKVKMAHGHQNIFGTKEEKIMRKVPCDILITGHLHAHDGKTLYANEEYTHNIKWIKAPSIVGATDYSDDWDFKSVPSGLKVIINKQYGLIGEIIIPCK